MSNNSYVCTGCGYIYRPEEGDSTQGIPKNTSFEALPDTWVCPDCYLPKDAFDPY